MPHPELSTPTVREQITEYLGTLILAMPGVDAVFDEDDVEDRDIAEATAGGHAVAQVLPADDESDTERADTSIERVRMPVLVSWDLPSSPANDLEGLTKREAAARLHGLFIQRLEADAQLAGLALDTMIVGGGGMGLNPITDRPMGVSEIIVVYRFTRGAYTEPR